MITVELEFSGDDETKRHLGAIPDAIRLRLQALLPVLGQEIRDAAAGLAPHKSGKLARSMRATLRDSGDTLLETIRPSAFYGRFQETGLQTMRRSRRQRGVVGTRIRMSGGVASVSPRRGLLRRQTQASSPFHLPAHPFMRPAFESLRSRIEDSLKAAVAEGLA